MNGSAMLEELHSSSAIVIGRDGMAIKNRGPQKRERMELNKARRRSEKNAAKAAQNGRKGFRLRQHPASGDSAAPL
jgi:hypothetical protein